MNQHLIYKGKLSKLAEALIESAIIFPTDLGCTMVLSDSCKVPCGVCGRVWALLINRYGVTRCVGCDAEVFAAELADAQAAEHSPRVCRDGGSK